MRFEPAKTGAQKLLAEKLRADHITFAENQWLEGWEVDIFLPQYYLVIEIDGFYHLSARQQAKDAEKDQRLQAAGYHVLRFTNSQIYQESKDCLREIKAFISGHERQVKKGAKVVPGPAGWQEQLAAYQRRIRNGEEKNRK